MAGGTARAGRALLLVCDSFGVGEAPDADAYGDRGSNTLGHVAAAVGGVHAPNLAARGLGAGTDSRGLDPAGGGAGAAPGEPTERPAGNDATTGRWAMGG